MKALPAKQYPVITALVTFSLVMAFHFTWLGLFPETDPAQAGWAAAPSTERSWLTTYLREGHYWMGYSYALSLGFAAFALHWFRRERLANAGRAAASSLTFAGALAIFGCFLLGCCGSPMLGVYVSLLGAWFLPFARPLVAIVTTLVIAASAWWLFRRKRACPETCCPAPASPPETKAAAR